MLSILIGVIGLLAVLAWATAVLSALQLVRMAPAGTRFSTYGKIGWWRFEDVRQKLGAGAEQHIRTYKRSFLVFIACVLAAMALGALLTLQAQN